ncbi:hypothetical protein SAMD00019534_023280, partial [Acytostelium subglobosum LB1]|uniref:hypothetical protein n=1 Tax=Acytostelium subglobosum LB1 TaxID=1410327 RepID=UPI000644EA64
MMQSLPHTILQHILSSLDNLDRLCFTLTCKLWFEQRDRYLVLHTSDTFLFSAYYYANSPLFKFNSYRMALCRSLEKHGGLFDQEVSNQPMDTPIYAYVNYLYFSNTFNYPLPKLWIPGSITTLRFGFSFNHPLLEDTLPFGLRTLAFGNSFNQRIIPGTLPTSLRKLAFGNDFNKPLEFGAIPNGVETISFGNCYDEPLVAGTLPSSTKHLCFGNNFDQDVLPSVLPKSIVSLKFGYYFNRSLSGGVLPPQLKSLRVDRGFKKELMQKDLPESITKLRYVYHKNSLSLPKCTTNLVIDEVNDPLEPGTVPPSVTKLEFSHDYNHGIEVGVIPPSVTSLKVGIVLAQKLKPNMIPMTVTSIDMGLLYNRQLEPGLLPKSVTTLRLGSTFRHRLDPKLLPRLTRLEVPSHYKHPIPNTVTSLRLHNGVYYNFSQDQFDLEALPSTTTVALDIPTLERINIRLMDDRYSIFLSDHYFVGGFFSNQSMNDGSFLQQPKNTLTNNVVAASQENIPDE